MTALLDDPLLVFRFPLLVFFFSLAGLWLAAWIGSVGFKGLRAQVAESREDFSVVQGATLTLLGLIIGFTFSMALGRYDQRKNYEEEEANAIGTEYLRADLLIFFHVPACLPHEPYRRIICLLAAARPEECIVHIAVFSLSILFGR